MRPTYVPTSRFDDRKAASRAALGDRPDMKPRLRYALYEAAWGMTDATEGVHREAREHGGVAACGPCAAARDARNRVSERDGVGLSRRRVPPRSQGVRLRRGSERPHRVSLGGGAIRSVASDGG